MIDLHCHLLPGIDDGAPNLATSLSMARIAVEDGIKVIACTPHIYPGMYENTGPAIRQAVVELQTCLEEADIPLRITHGADTHITPDLVAGLRSGRVPSLHDSRYFLLEPPHHVAPPRLEETVFNLLAAGYVPVITHPERLSWIEDHYEVFLELARKGAWMQVTSGSLTGRFGATAQYWGERLLDEGWVHILATDSHGVDRRPPLLTVEMGSTPRGYVLGAFKRLRGAQVHVLGTVLTKLAARQGAYGYYRSYYYYHTDYYGEAPADAKKLPA